MDLTIKRFDHNEPGSRRATLSVSGEIDSDTAPQLQNALAALHSDAVDSVVVDLANTTFVSSAGLSVLVGGKKTFSSFAIKRGNRIVDRLITLTGLSDLYCDAVEHSAEANPDGPPSRSARP